MKKLIGIIFVAMIAMTIGCSNPHTPQFHEGYVKEAPRVWGTGGFRGVLVGPSNFGVSLWRNQVLNIDMRPVTKTEKFKILAKDELNVSFRVEAVMQPVKGSVQSIVEDYGANEWYERFIQKPYRAFVRDAVRTYTSRELKDKRTEISASVNELLSKHIGNAPFNVISVVVGNIDYPKVVTDAVEKKLAAQQLLEEKAVQRKIAKQDAEIKIEEAKGIAKAQEIINKTLTSNYLTHEAIQAQLKMADSPNTTVVYIPVGANGVPLVKMTQ